MGRSGAIHKGDFNLIEVVETENDELYNVRQEIGADHGIALVMPKLLRELARD